MPEGAREVRIKIKRLGGTEKGPIPAYMTEQSAGLDICAHVNENVVIPPGQRRLIPTGLAVAIPDVFGLQVRPRSG